MLTVRRGLPSRASLVNGRGTHCPAPWCSRRRSSRLADRADGGVGESPHGGEARIGGDGRRRRGAEAFAVMAAVDPDGGEAEFLRWDVVVEEALRDVQN